MAFLLVLCCTEMEGNLLEKKDKGYYLSILSLIVLIGVLVSYFYGPVFFHPNQFLLNDGGDAFKNYFTYEWYIQNDNSFIDYIGSNYPYGENHLYTDGTPILSNLIKLLPFLKPYSIDIFNFSMLISLFVCALILFKIFRLFHIENWKAILSAVGITVLCPQALRYTGHFALSYGFCIPLIIYLLLTFNLDRQHKLKRSVVISLVSIFIFFIHPYLGMICASFIIFYWIFKLLFERNKSGTFILEFILQAIIPVVFYFLIVKLTDHHSDRNALPYGFFYLNSSIETIFISTHKPFRHLLSQLYKIKSQNGEGIAYIGIASLIMFFYTLYLFFKNRARATQVIKEDILLKNYLLMFFSAIMLLLFSMGFPFNIGLSWILDHVPTIQQFRAPGRFAWVFYFIVCIGVCIIICKYSFRKLPRTSKTILIFLLLCLYTIEGIPYHNEVTKAKFPVNIFKEEYLSKELKDVIAVIKGIKPQSIIPLPFFHVGTDYYNIAGTGNITNSSFVISLHSKVPLMANLTPRNSLTEAQKLIQIISSDLIHKDIRGDLTSTDPFVILYTKEFLDENEQSLLNRGTLVLETENYIIKQITLEQLFYNSTASKISFFEANKLKMLRTNHLFLTDSSYVHFNGFDHLPNQRLEGNVNDTNILFEIEPNKLMKDERYELSFWYRAKDKLDMNNLLIIEEEDANGNTQIIAQKNMYSMNNVTKDGTLAILPFAIKNVANRIMISLTGTSDREKTFFLDDLMIRQKNTNVYRLYYSDRIKDSILNYNNIDLFHESN
ncbi:MAG: hypothetical protein V4677_07530 [Bacteroidota bacterium]